MQKIKQLSQHEIQKIAAGQVVERPANIVKELLENAIDAGATSITVYCQEAGQKAIRIIDNGCGMSRTDAQFCFERHATSKLSTFDELSSITTFGFRGEALYTVGAVSSVTLITKEAASSEGTKILFHNGELKQVTSVACSTGTDITVEHLFDNVPARKKFLKKEETEWRVIVQLFQAFCFSHRLIHFQLYSDDKLVYNCPPVGSLCDRGAQVWDLHTADNLLETSYEDRIKITGLISQPHFFRYNRNTIFLFVNKRWVKNYELVQALLKGYLNVLPPARYPIAVMDIGIDPVLVDTNIHPRKEEVKFIQSKDVEQVLIACVKKALEKRVSLQLNKEFTKPNVPSYGQAIVSQQFQSFFKEREPYVQEAVSVCKNPVGSLPDLFDDIKNVDSTLNKNIQDVESNIPLQQEKVVAQTHEYQIVGNYARTYILLEQEDGLLFVDQHAAHERVLFEQLNTKLHASASITLLFPETLYFSQHDCNLLMQHSLLLSEHGIIYDMLGENQIVLRSIPVHLKSVKWSEFFQQVLEIFNECMQLEKSEFLNQVHKKLQAQMACKAAVKAGDCLSHQQITQLLDDLACLENRFTCPHGRPTSWLLPRLDIEKKFKRKK